MGLESKDPYGSDDFKSDGSGQVVALLGDVDHVGIAVEDLDEAIEEYRETFGVLVQHREVLVDDGIEVAVLGIGSGAVHLLGAHGAHSPLLDFVDTYGPGVHHVGYRVSDCAAALAAVVAAGHDPIDVEPKPGVLGTVVASVEPMTLHGVTVQFVQPAR